MSIKNSQLKTLVTWWPLPGFARPPAVVRGSPCEGRFALKGDKMEEANLFSTWNKLPRRAAVAIACLFLVFAFCMCGTVMTVFAPTPTPTSTAAWKLTVVPEPTVTDTPTATSAASTATPEPINTPTMTARPTETPWPTAAPTQPLPTAVTQPANSPAPVCDCSSNLYNCTRDFGTQAEAQACYDYCLPIAGDIHDLDRDNNGAACEDSW